MAYGIRRRRGMRGLGDMLPACSSLNLPPGFVGPVNCDSSTGPVNYTPSASQVADLSSQLQALQGAPSLSAWLSANSGTVLLGTLAFVGLLMVSRR